jgi:hypothetical protein
LGPWLAGGGPLYTLLDARGRAGIGIADLTVIRDDEDLAVEVGKSVEYGETRPIRGPGRGRWGSPVPWL